MLIHVKLYKNRYCNQPVCLKMKNSDTKKTQQNGCVFLVNKRILAD